MVIVMMMLLASSRKTHSWELSMCFVQVEQLARVERLEQELGREQDRLRAMLNHLTTSNTGPRVQIYMLMLPAGKYIYLMCSYWPPGRLYNIFILLE